MFCFDSNALASNEQCALSPLFPLILSLSLPCSYLYLCVYVCFCRSLFTSFFVVVVAFPISFDMGYILIRTFMQFNTRFSSFRYTLRGWNIEIFAHKTRDLMGKTLQTRCRMIWIYHFGNGQKMHHALMNAKSQSYKTEPVWWRL